MKRSEMLEHIRSELRETMHGLSISNEKINQYFWRRANGLLDMIEGFNMLPPGEVNEVGNVVHEWEPENEEK
jgi:hypothetical protein